MKKLIVLSLVFALVASAAFAMDVTGTVFGHVNVVEGSTEKDSKVTSSGALDRVRLDGSFGDDGFGGYIRFQYGYKPYLDFQPWFGGGTTPHETGADFALLDSANAWWKPIDQLKLIIGNNSDGFWGKEGVTGWGFNAMPNDSGVATNYGIWYGNGWGSSFYAGGAYMHNRYVFFEGAVERGLLLEITPADIFGINIAIPFIDQPGEAKDVFKAAIAQININLDVGNIAITYDGNSRTVQGAGAGGVIFASFGGSFGDLGLDVGLSYHLAGDPDKGQSDKAQPIGFGVGVKYATDTFGVKFRTTAVLGGEVTKDTYINSSVLPYFTLSDSLSAFVNVGLGMIMPDSGDTVVGWYFNPYLRVGAEWGPTFYAGIQVSSDGQKNGDGDKPINWAVPISLMVSF